MEAAAAVLLGVVRRAAMYKRPMRNGSASAAEAYSGLRSTGEAMILEKRGIKPWAYQVASLAMGCLLLEGDKQVVQGHLFLQMIIRISARSGHKSTRRC